MYDLYSPTMLAHNINHKTHKRSLTSNVGDTTTRNNKVNKYIYLVSDNMYRETKTGDKSVPYL